MGVDAFGLRVSDESEARELPSPVDAHWNVVEIELCLLSGAVAAADGDGGGGGESCQSAGWAYGLPVT
eukprot:CAMPEP_0174726032 /NCGR_PEP_ID=MMETSP1094-20130205/46922_1 /TAXON_ID=156173 /ORGANISM="Chrysochromulina brevifilum, Strain UTEX LB 985" /LENGTH=67 /DNA_ID=CAMNT_0015927541 /DNA_START=32 /DNA_END=232 /DNA_ORIENTATION=-